MTRSWIALALIAWAGLSGCSGSDGATGKQGPQGPSGPAGPGGNPSVNAVVPSSAFLGGAESITISGFATSWTDSAHVDFGAGVTVDSMQVASPTAIVAHVSVAFDATPGIRDVTVTDGGSTLTYKGAFSVDPATALSVQGTLAQGSVVMAKVTDLDFTRPFDATTAGDGLFTPISWPNIEVSTDTGVASQLQSAQAYSLDTILLIDLDVVAGKTKLDVLSGPVGGTRENFPNPTALDVAARTPKPLALGQATSVNLQDPYASEIYSVTPPGSSLNVVELSATTTNTSANPQVLVMPASGHFGELLGVGPDVVLASSSSAKLNVVVWDNSGTAGYAATLRADATAATGADEAEPNNTTAQAQAASSLPFVLQNASLSSGSDEDWIAVTAAAGDVGKSIRVITMPGDPQTDTLVEVFAGDGTTSLGGPSDDANYHENWLSTPISTAGKYYVKITASPFYSSSQTKYQALVRFE